MPHPEGAVYTRSSQRRPSHRSVRLGPHGVSNSGHVDCGNQILVDETNEDMTTRCHTLGSPKAAQADDKETCSRHASGPTARRERTKTDVHADGEDRHEPATPTGKWAIASKREARTGRLNERHPDPSNLRCAAACRGGASGGVATGPWDCSPAQNSEEEIAGAVAARAEDAEAGLRPEEEATTARRPPEHKEGEAKGCATRKLADPTARTTCRSSGGDVPPAGGGGGRTSD